jgi:hypothetical protein
MNTNNTQYVPVAPTMQHVSNGIYFAITKDGQKCCGPIYLDSKSLMFYCEDHSFYDENVNDSDRGTVVGYVLEDKEVSGGI